MLSAIYKGLYQVCIKDNKCMTCILPVLLPRLSETFFTDLSSASHRTPLSLRTWLSTVAQVATLINWVGPQDERELESSCSSWRYRLACLTVVVICTWHRRWHAAFLFGHMTQKQTAPKEHLQYGICYGWGMRWDFGRGGSKAGGWESCEFLPACSLVLFTRAGCQCLRLQFLCCGSPGFQS